MSQPYNVKAAWLELAMNLSPATVQAMHGMTRKYLAEEDALEPGIERPYGIREHSDFRVQADVFEDAMRRRGIDFVAIDWSPRNPESEKS